MSTAAATTTVTLDGNNVSAANVNGLTFKGFGVLSANGTSAVLMDYKSQHPDAYATLLQILFGGTNRVITQVKMGNDRNNSTGPDPATMTSKELYQTFTLRGLTAGAHTVELKVLSGTLVVDAVGVVP